MNKCKKKNMLRKKESLQKNVYNMLYFLHL